MATACKEAVRVLRIGGGSTEAAVSATTVLEACFSCPASLFRGTGRTRYRNQQSCHSQDSAVTNAGLGSNLNEDGFVECDASVMSGDGCFGAVGACPGTPLSKMHTIIAKNLNATLKCMMYELQE